MQIQRRNDPVSRQAHAILSIKPSARVFAKQAFLQKSDIAPKTDTQQADIQNRELSGSPTSPHETPQNEPVTKKTEQSAQSQAETQSGANYAHEPFDEETVLPLLRNDVAEICKAGDELKTEETAYSNKTQELAIKALAKILGLRHKYFNPIADDTVAIDTLKDELYKQCERKRKSEATHEFHLFSMIFRKKDRRQASADTKVLKRAHAEGQTEESFAAWVKKNRSLSDIVKKVNKDEREAQETKEQRKQAQRAAKGKAKALFDAALEASWMHMGRYGRDELPESMIDLIPNAGFWRPIAIKYDGEKVIFYSLQKDSNYNELNGHKIENIEPESDADGDDIADGSISNKADESVTA
ncbi:hypothetical protein AWB69_05708 [Caballeronia udeis]|uniref:Uncharacterized protein n=1 Tax=Caballeronia udeis TaxID=1232866 RepID=A0A158ID71_9BURK|nr:hypothetical protein [Caballeronia udeis]SAL53940.1 hypothetical protein AWB69_05708 [Caballeronia udeis]